MVIGMIQGGGGRGVWQDFAYIRSLSSQVLFDDNDKTYKNDANTLYTSYSSHFIRMHKDMLVQGLS